MTEVQLNHVLSFFEGDRFRVDVAHAEELFIGISDEVHLCQGEVEVERKKRKKER